MPNVFWICDRRSRSFSHFPAKGNVWLQVYQSKDGFFAHEHSVIGALKKEPLQIFMWFLWGFFQKFSEFPVNFEFLVGAFTLISSFCFFFPFFHTQRIFKITTSCLLCSLIFPCYIVAKHASAVYKKHYKFDITWSLKNFKFSKP